MPKGFTQPREVKCAGCSTPFIATGSRSKWCSRKCMDAKIWDNKHRKSVTCKQCKNLITRNYSRGFCSSECKREWYSTRTDSGRAWYLKTNYNITPEQFNALLEKQYGKCAVCKLEVPLHIDHDHSCCPIKARSCGKCIRGLLCSNCNNGLGRFQDNSEVLQNAVDYIYQFKSSILNSTTTN